MRASEYQEQIKRTMNNDLTEEQKISNMLAGMLGELGEVADLIKKHLYQGHPLELNKMHEELGDSMWYVGNFCNLFDFKLEDIMAANIAKLQKRYPNGFDVERSLKREEEVEQNEQLTLDI